MCTLVAKVSARRDLLRRFDDEARRMIVEIAREAIDMETGDAIHDLAEIVAAFETSLALAAG
jgi:hypothetical protein